MQTLFDLDNLQIIEPNEGDIVEMQGYKAVCQVWDRFNGNHCEQCFFRPFPASVCCDLIRCYASEREDRTFINFKEVIQ